MPRTTAAFLCFLCSQATLPAHDISPRSEPTYTIAAPAAPDPRLPVFVLDVHDSDGKPIAARFSISIDGKPWSPDSLNEHGLHFTSIHTAKKQRATILYARGTGPLQFNLPSSGAKGEITITRGYEYLPLTLPLPLGAKPLSIPKLTAELHRWSNLRAQGWISADEHLHYERSDPKHDADWFTMLRADGLDQGFFMILDGGNLPGPWARQHTYGMKGRVTDSGLSLIPGEEYRGSLQGHNNLHGIAKVLHPLSVGRPKSKIPPEIPNWPSTHDVLKKISATGGIGGPAHGGTFGKASTAIRDAVLGASEFFELANTHLYELDPWYRLLDCGYLLPPVAGTDLPNFPWREPWQPFLGETRTYVRLESPDATPDFESWKNSLRAGRSFITSGPLISLSVNGQDLGETVSLSSGEEDLEVLAEAASPFPLSTFEIVVNGEVLPLTPSKSVDSKGVHRWTIRSTIPLSRSSWFAARAVGLRKKILWAESGINRRATAHTAAIPVLLDGQPVFDQSTAASLITDLETQREVYATQGKFPHDEARAHTLALFDEAIAALQDRPAR